MKLPLRFLNRFGKPQLLISNHMDALLKLPIVSSVHEMKKLRDLYDRIEINKFEGSTDRIRVLWKFISSSCNGENSFGIEINHQSQVWQ